MKRVIMLLALGLLAGQVGGQALGHRITSNEVIVDRASHWENWAFPAGTARISATGAVRPNRLENNTNAARDIVHYLRLNPPQDLDKEPEDIVLLDAIEAGTRAADVRDLLDGDPSTFWEPAPLDPDKPVADQWWFIVDLGRYVLSDRIVLKFVGEGLGDPFLLFDVLVSDGRLPSGLTKGEPVFRPVLRVFTPNKRQREFEIELDSNDELPGQGVRFVQVAITGSDTSRAFRVDAEEHARLRAESPADAGAVEYYKRQADGRQVLVDSVVYAQLEEERRAEIRYFRRERPRLAELEVWHQGDEILMGAKSRGGSFSTDSDAIVSVLADGDVVALSTVTEQGPVPPLAPNGYYQFDLGAFFWVNRHMIYYPPAGRLNKFDEYRLEVSDGSLAADGSLSWKVVVDRVMNPDFFVGHEYNVFEPVRARFFRFLFPRIASKNSGGALAVSEMHVYGRGFQPQVSLESDLIRLGNSRNLLSIEWEADTPPDTRVVLQTRTGNELEVINRYFKQINPALPRSEVSAEEYENLRDSWKAGIESEERLGSDWSDWSEPYRDPTGSAITSPSPRQFVKVRAILQSDDPEASATLHQVRLRFVQPVAQRLLAEVMPFRVDSLGVDRRLSLFIRPEFSSGDPGFDQLRLTGPADMNFDFVQLYAGTAQQLTDPGADLEALRVPGVEVLATAVDTMRLGFDAITPSSQVEVLRLDFVTSLFSGGALLRAALQSTGDEGGWQRIDAGDVLAGVESSTTTLVAEDRRLQLFSDVRQPQPVVTPNGDGVNDEAIFEFTVLRVADDSPVAVELFDVSGRRVRRIEERRALGSGQYRIGWDGLDDAGQRVPPGLYLARIKVSTDMDGTSLKDKEILRTVAVAY